MPLRLLLLAVSPIRAHCLHAVCARLAVLWLQGEEQAAEGGGSGQSGQQRMAAAAQEFAYRFLSQYSRTQYVRYSLERYKSLFAPGEMDKLLRAASGPGGLSMQSILDAIDGGKGARRGQD